MKINKKILYIIGNWKLGIGNFSSGMTYVELIVVLAIFSTMSSVVIFNYGEFQAQVDIKNVANDIALQLVEAQKSANFGNLPSSSAHRGLLIADWKPAYGVSVLRNSDILTYFVDANNNNTYEGSSCSGECFSQISLTKGNKIGGIKVYYYGNSTPASFSDITVTFTRPSQGAVFRSAQNFSSSVAYVEVEVTSPKQAKASVRVYPSGRIQIN